MNLGSRVFSSPTVEALDLPSRFVEVIHIHGVSAVSDQVVEDVGVAPRVILDKIPLFNFLYFQLDRPVVLFGVLEQELPPVEVSVQTLAVSILVVQIELDCQSTEYLTLCSLRST